MGARYCTVHNEGLSNVPSVTISARTSVSTKHLPFNPRINLPTSNPPFVYRHSFDFTPTVPTNKTPTYQPPIHAPHKPSHIQPLRSYTGKQCAIIWQSQNTHPSTYPPPIQLPINPAIPNPPFVYRNACNCAITKHTPIHFPFKFRVSPYTSKPPFVYRQFEEYMSQVASGTGISTITYRGMIQVFVQLPTSNPPFVYRHLHKDWVRLPDGEWCSRSSDDILTFGGMLNEIISRPKNLHLFNLTKILLHPAL
ncbi:uncharacterized protein LACBIDRAFT_333763 [Laccaria bicolor S238N-H82]|uniref:Predicted protein n=1 Tax=Laccaria bicolor (strain S238N-H82 / ATCC MYA-4686) TaxID=486041 RepID=B0DWZ9_LACBS|nr:uncharacterized protein LACBIDRAFT_333763 [Laccaria bicolor S238N-H82]EDR00847.1 predicted protein [Laccaria bicolor S238N-H82]|eukprot:XP_001888441.1 predicted protein [Laccaria bicolor S238N-H82]